MPTADVPPSSEYALTEAQKTHFLRHGFIRLPGCFTREQANEFTSTVWTRLGMSETDKKTWHTERTNMPLHGSVKPSEFAPRAWAGMCELLGSSLAGEKLGVGKSGGTQWGDGFIVNLGQEGWDKLGEEERDALADPRQAGGWHTDGDFFVHFLDSPEQALLVIPLFSDIVPHGGGTYICEDGIGLVARHLVWNFHSEFPASPRIRS
jgi:hypothetical protein